MPKKLIVTNFAYGTGPYLRTTELALAFNDELEKRGKERLGIIVPLVYGDRQKKVMAEEFGNLWTSDVNRPSMDVRRPKDEIILDEKLGAILKSIFYGDNTYEEAFKQWSENVKEVSKAAHEHLKKTYGESIAVELNRSPRIRYDIAPTYFTTFGYLAEILENIKKLQLKEVGPLLNVQPHEIDLSLLKKGIEVANWVESSAEIHAVAYPATFSWQKDYKARYATEILTPPIRRPYSAHSENINPGIFVTITGIPGLERLYGEARTMGLNLYSNDPKSIYGRPTSIGRLSASDVKFALPHIVTNQNIFFQFARSGWGSVWLSMMSGTPLVVPDFDPKDDPEIYFNNFAVEKLGIGIVYRDQQLEEILAKTGALKTNSKKICDKILARWDTIDGTKYCAKIFAEDFLKKARN